MHGSGSERLARLTAPSLISLTHFPVPAALQPFLTTVLVLRCDETQMLDMLPAGVGYLGIALTGSGIVRFATGRIDPVRSFNLLAPTSAAVELEVAGPLLLVAGALSPLGWAALTGLDASRHADRSDDGADLWAAEADRLVQELHALRRNEAADQALADHLSGFIAARLGPVNARHARLIKQVADWLSASFSPDLADLQRSTGYSDRQLQRLVTRYFGAGPKQLARKYRALRVAAVLGDAQTSDERAAELVNLFYDQSHMIREIRHFLGRTPARLSRDADTLLAKASGISNFRDIKPNVARIPGD